MDCNNAFNRLDDSLLASALQFYFPSKNEPKPKTTPMLDVDLFELKRAYNVPVDLDIRLEEDITNESHHSDEEELEEHLPIEFCESLIDEEEDCSNEGQTTDESNEQTDQVPEEQNHFYNCIHCVYKGTIGELRNHYELLHKDCTRSVHWCVECKVDFENEAILKLHKVQEHVFYCSKCFYSFKTQRELLAHMSVHSRSKGYQCTICNKIFPIRRYFVRHLERHEKKKREPEKVSKREEIFKCTQCEKQFMKKESLVKHTKIHSRDSLKCSLCDFTCGKKVTLKMHVISHEGNRKYKCDRCDFSFKQVGHLKRHIARFNH
ncbi:zinc finger protein 501-like [Macrosteles quadrilineatus]|uniref:zinc finger protein 501-like n=1 Tax=Macrosteles quadrilineatus TaxID=74068 RepID=UPI0023E14D6A|nr:zinc finger protein 501-like [Macrosteles quadrilineatus]XP_054282262.1 zinc finger protein 501-like [Macrosteles quadrilineatus]